MTHSNSLFKKYYEPVSLVVIVSLSSIMFSCNNAQEEQKKADEDSIAITGDIAREDSALFFENKADEWLDLSLNKFTGSWRQFRLQEFWYEDSIKKEPFKAQRGFFQDYAPLLKWSPDSNYVLDIGTYGKVLVKDKKGNIKIEDGEVDTKASLIFPKTDSSEELIFLGAGGHFIDGRWIDSAQFSILGVFDEAGDQNPDTLLWIIDAREKFFRKYILQ